MTNTQNDSYTLRPALCLDLDGTVRRSKKGRFINMPEDILLYEGVEEIIWGYREQGYLVCGITNQGGVAFNFKTEEDVLAELQATRALFEKDPFDTIKYSPKHPGGLGEPYNHRSLLRKPYYGMLVECELKFWEEKIIIDWDESIFVGDREEDKLCAEAAGLKFVWAEEFFKRK